MTAPHHLEGTSQARERVLYVQYTNPAAYPPVEHGARLLAEAGCKVALLGTENQGHQLRLAPHSRMQVHLMAFEGGGWRQKLHYARFTLWSLAWTLRWRPTWVYASDPLACPVALLLSYLPGVQVVYHEHDSPMPDAERDRRTSAFMRMVLRARRALALRASVCVLPSDGRAEIFRRTLGRADTVTVWNCPSRRECAPPRSTGDGRSLRVWYHGSIVPARVPLSVVRALTRLPDKVTLSIAGYETIGHIGWIERLREVAVEAGVASRVEFLGPIHRHELLDACGGHDVGLALLPLDAVDINEQQMVGASNKPFDYLARGLALLVSDLPAWRAMYVDRGFARCCDPADPDSIAAALRWFAEHPVDMRGMGERGRRQIVDAWNYDWMFIPVLERVLGLGPGRATVRGYEPTGAGEWS